jgi:ribonuclease Z
VKEIAMRRILLAFLSLVVLASLAVFVGLRIPAVQDRLFAFALSRLAAAPDAVFDDGALRVLFCGTSSPLPHPSRAKACVAVFAGKSFWVVDTGPSSWNSAALSRIDGSKVGGVLITHFHSDHIGDLGEWNLQTWVAGRPGPLPVYGGPGIERVVAGFTEAYALDTGYRIAHHGADFLKETSAHMEAHPVEPGVIVDQDGLRITAFAVPHKPATPAYGYRFDYRGRSVVVSGDTTESQELVDVSRGADVLVHEELTPAMIAKIGEVMAANGRSRAARIMADIPGYHTDPVIAAREANDANVGLLVFYHLLPPPQTDWMEQMLVRGVDAVRSKGWIVADDGTLVELPPESKAISISKLR